MRHIWVCGLALAALAGAAVGQDYDQEHKTTTTTTKTTKSGDTTTTTTTTTKTESHSGGFHFGPPPNQDRDEFTYERLGGNWKIAEAHGSKMCDLKLDSTKFISSYGAHTGIGCPDGLFGVSSWVLMGDEIRLMSPGGTLLAALRPGGHKRFVGKTAAGLEIFMTKE